MKMVRVRSEYQASRGLMGADFDFVDRSAPMDALGRLRELVKYLPTAESATIQLYPQLDTKDATRVRIKIIYTKDKADAQEVTEESLDAVTWDN